MLWHDDFFTLPNGQVQPVLKMGKFEGRFVILHPFFHFGSAIPFSEEVEEEDEYEPKVYLQQFEIPVDKGLFDVNDLLFNVEKNCHLKPDEVFWYETGFWTIVLNSDFYFGMGLARLKEILEEEKPAEFAVCLSNNISITLMNSQMGKERRILLSVYASNDIIPFVEALEPFRKSVKHYHGVKQLKSELLPERQLRRFWGSNRKISVDPVAFAMDLEHKEYIRLPFIKNPFTRVKDSAVSKTRYLTGTTSGGFIESDYDGKKKFLPWAEIWELASASIVDFHFEQT